MTLKELKKNVRTAISNARIREAVEMLLAWTSENSGRTSEMDVILLKGRLSRLERDEMSGVISHETVVIDENSIASAILDLVNSVTLTALQIIHEAKETRAISLDLGNCGLTELPDELFELTWLEELILSSSGGCTLMKQIGGNHMLLKMMDSLIIFHRSHTK